MAIIDLNNFNDNVWLAGDIHGDARGMATKLKNANVRDAAIILLGDIGLGFSGNHAGPVPYLNRIGKDRNNHFYIIRGNHDCPESWTDEIIAQVKERYENSDLRRIENVHWVRDFDELLICGKSFLAVGGAISIDRMFAVTKVIHGAYVHSPRPEGKCYWKNEHIDYDRIDSIDKSYFGVLAHTGPTPPSLSRSTLIKQIEEKYDKELPGDVEKEREGIDKIIEKSNIKLWCNGHYHVQYDSIHAQGDRFFNYKDIKVVNLGIDEISNITKHFSYGDI